MDWLLKTEPSDYSYEDLAREKRTAWEGVSNPLAKKHLALMSKGDRCVVYHTGGVKAAVGLARVAMVKSDASAVPGGRGTAPVVEIEAVRHLHAPVPLEAIKASPLFAGSALVTMGRLSVVALTPAQFSFLAGGGR